MMSQNRQATRDRLRARNDYLVNLKAELEIRLLHEKLDHLLRHQWERLMEIQEIQIELMNQLAQRGSESDHRCTKPRRLTIDGHIVDTTARIYGWRPAWAHLCF